MNPLGFSIGSSLIVPSPYRPAPIANPGIMCLRTRYSSQHTQPTTEGPRGSRRPCASNSQFDFVEQAERVARISICPGVFVSVPKPRQRCMALGADSWAYLLFHVLKTTLRAGGNGNRQDGLGGEPPFGRTRRRVNTTPMATTAIEIPASSAYPSGAGRPRNEGGGDEAATTWNRMLDVVWVREPLVPVTVTA